MSAEDYLNKKGIYNHPRLGEHDVAELMEEYAKEQLQKVKDRIEIYKPIYPQGDWFVSQDKALNIATTLISKTIKNIDQ